MTLREYFGKNQVIYHSNGVKRTSDVLCDVHINGNRYRSNFVNIEHIEDKNKTKWIIWITYESEFKPDSRIVEVDFDLDLKTDANGRFCYYCPVNNETYTFEFFKLVKMSF